jgi:hypothetical protein
MLCLFVTEPVYRHASEAMRCLAAMRDSGFFGVCADDRGLYRLVFLLQEERRPQPAAAWGRFSEAKRCASVSSSSNLRLHIRLSQSWVRLEACSSET